MNMLNAKFRQGPRESDPWVPTATYDEPPFPIIEGTAACSAMRNLAAEHTNIGEQLHVLTVLRAVFKEMGDRESVSDPWLQHRATVPSRAVIERYNNEMQLYSERESGYPRAPMSLRQAFKKDAKVQGDISRMMKDKDVSASVAKKLKTIMLGKLFEETERTPGGLDRFYRVIEKDQERYSRELSAFKRKQKEFDRERGLLPHE